MATLNSNPPWLKSLERRREKTHNDKSALTSRLNFFHWRNRKNLPSLYTKVPLRDPRSEIRLLEILPGTTEVIKCRLRSVPLDNTGDYEGLSYHWLGDVLENVVYVNSVDVPVHENLFNALCYLRHVKTKRVLWVDAICIDQTRDEEDGEKSHQLQLMRRIYRQALRTVAYIGREAIGEGGTHILDQFIKQILHSIALLQQREPRATSLGKSVLYLSTTMRLTCRIPGDDHIGWKTLADLVSRSWVHRLWVVQEAAVARNVVMQCGPFSFDFDDVAAAYLLMLTISVPEVFEIPTCFREIVTERAKQKAGLQSTLLALVIRHWLSDCKHQQDKIYALRGLAYDVGPGMHGDEFDYEKSVEDVYTEFAQDSIRIHGNLDILFALAAFHEDRSTELPSWVPDWRVFGNYTFLYNRPEHGPDPGDCTVLFTASGNTRADPQFSADGRCMQLHGHILDTIIAVGAIHRAIDTVGEAVAHLISWRNDIARCQTETSYTPTHEPMIDAFYHTLTMANVSASLINPLAEYPAFDVTVLQLATRLAHPSDKAYYSAPGTAASAKETQIPWSAIETSAVTSAAEIAVNRAMVRTESGYLGLVHGQAAVGDKVALMRGGMMPLVIREAGREGVWRIVGDGYVHGVMGGEAFDEERCEGFWFV